MRYTDPRRKGEKEERKEMQQFIGHDFFFFTNSFQMPFKILACQMTVNL